MKLKLVSPNAFHIWWEILNITHHYGILVNRFNVLDEIKFSHFDNMHKHILMKFNLDI